PWQATFGKRLLNIYISRDDGTRITLARSSGRWLMQCFLGFFGGSLISLVTIETSQRGKALHDFVSGTTVWKGRPVTGGKLEGWRIVSFVGLPFLWLVTTLISTM